LEIFVFINIKDLHGFGYIRCLHCFIYIQTVSPDATVPQGATVSSLPGSMGTQQQHLLPQQQNVNNIQQQTQQPKKQGLVLTVSSCNRGNND
jgi:hypothetical protein